MNVAEHPLTFDCAGETLVGVLSLPLPPAVPGKVGVLIVVGGPQYRAGSHRQFVQVARSLAAAGFAVLRFDVRGMGDSSGEARSFEELDDDVAAALGAFARAVPGLQRTVLYGLCDGASASLLYLQRRGPDPRVAGLVLLNPWVRTTAGEAETRVRHYYRERLKSAEFWRKLLSGRVAFGALAEALGALRRMLAGRRSQGGGGGAGEPPRNYVERMARAASAFDGPLLLVTSGRDFTAKEFLLAASHDARWQQVLGRPSTRHVEMAEADHTFSDLAQQREMQAQCARWLRECLASTA
jgi:exosortase A-associated hydrolase 1